jgi:hypothetical protein
MKNQPQTLAKLVATYNVLALAAGKPERKSFDNKTVAELAIKSLTPKKSTGAALKIRKAAQTREAGPRGFQFGPVWIKSIVDGAGIALKVSNLPKLLATAASKGIEVTKDLTQAEIVAMVAKAV